MASCGTLTPRYTATVLRLGVPQDRTHTLHVYGMRDQREALVEEVFAWLPVPPMVVHHWRPWTRTILYRVTERFEDTGGDHQWPHLVAIAAIALTLGIITYHTALS